MNFRNLEEEYRIQEIWENLNELEEINGETNIVDYECIGDSYNNLNDYELNNIKEGDNNNT